MDNEHTKDIDFTVDRNNLYKEESFTDLKTGSVRRMTPVNPDGSPDKSRKTLFFGQTQLMTPNGPLPVQNIIKAKDLQQAIKQFPEAMKETMDRMIEEAQKMQQQQQQQQKKAEDSRIIIPGR